MKVYFRTLLAGLMLLALVVFSSAVGTILANHYWPEAGNNKLPFVLNADTATGGEAMSMATGLIDRDRVIEGLFVLDHLSGNLQCWVINPRNGDIAGIYSANVNADLGLDKGGDIDYVMTTGNIRVEGRTGNDLPAGCVCYVGDGNTGKVVGYTLLYDRQLILNNGTQQGQLRVLARGLAREAGLKRD